MGWKKSKRINWQTRETNGIVIGGILYEYDKYGLRPQIDEHDALPTDLEAFGTDTKALIFKQERTILVQDRDCGMLSIGFESIEPLFNQLKAIVDVYG